MRVGIGASMPVDRGDDVGSGVSEGMDWVHAIASIRPAEKTMSTPRNRAIIIVYLRLMNILCARIYSSQGAFRSCTTPSFCIHRI